MTILDLLEAATTEMILKNGNLGFFTMQHTFQVSLNIITSISDCTKWVPNCK